MFLFSMFDTVVDYTHKDKQQNQILQIIGFNLRRLL